jgi:hypothetical protein
VANRVADNGKTVSDGLNYSHSEKLLRKLEQKYKLTPLLSNRQRHSMVNVPKYDQPRIQLRETVQACTQAANSLPEFTQAVEARGITAQLHFDAVGKTNGISFEINRQRFKGSQLARSLSLKGSASYWNRSRL